MNIPNRQESQRLLEEAGRLNPGPWVEHSILVGKAAKMIAARCPGMDEEAAEILGLLHDIGRREGVRDMRHTMDGFYYMQSLGYPDVARICITHCFPKKCIRYAWDGWDGTPEDWHFMEQYVAALELDSYDRLIALCDSLALPEGFCLIEKRLVDVALRHGINEYTVERWRSVFALQNEFEKIIGGSIYNLLPGVVETTFNSVLIP